MATQIVVIGASAGGVEALAELLQNIPEGLPAAVFVVLHQSAGAEGLLPKLLNRSSQMTVISATHGEPFKGGQIYVAPADFHLRLDDGRMQLDKGPKENRHRPAIDALFRSAAQAYGSRVIGIVLTGMLDDGTAGLWEIKRRGGTAIVQSPEEAVYPGMPLSALREVNVDHAVPLAAMGPLLTSLCANQHGMKRDPGTELES